LPREGARVLSRPSTNQLVGGEAVESLPANEFIQKCLTWSPRLYCEQPGAQLCTVTPHSLTEVLQGIEVQSGRVQATQAPELLQLCPAAQVPQVMVPPQPSEAVPQTLAPQAWLFDWGAQQAPL
jgi:hypothetical protein